MSYTQWEVESEDAADKEVIKLFQKDIEKYLDYVLKAEVSTTGRPVYPIGLDDGFSM